MDASGVLVVDKPSGPTSHDVVDRVRRALGIRRVGHCGTLDPLATGVLVLCVGPMTRFSRWLTGQDKEYDACFRLGATSDTDDALGRVAEAPPGVQPARSDIEAAMLAAASEAGNVQQSSTAPGVSPAAAVAPSVDPQGAPRGRRRPPPQARGGRRRPNGRSGRPGQGAARPQGRARPGQRGARSSGPPNTPQPNKEE